MTSTSARGYDDTAELMEMAIGIFDGRFKSVENAARSVLSNPTQSNVDRLRRKFRQQDWMNKGRQEFLRRSLEPDVVQSGREATFSEYVRVIPVRLRHPVTTIRAIFIRDIFWNAPWIQMMFHVWWITLLPVVVGLARISLGLGLGEGFTYWHMPFFALVSLMPLAFCLLMLEEHEGFPSLLEDGSGSNVEDQPPCPA